MRRHKFTVRKSGKVLATVQAPFYLDEVMYEALCKRARSLGCSVGDAIAVLCGDVLEEMLSDDSALPNDDE